MTKFIELTKFNGGKKVMINVDDISMIDEVRGHVFITMKSKYGTECVETIRQIKHMLNKC